MNNDLKQAILLAIDALESCGEYVVVGHDDNAEFVLGFDEDKVKAALKALQALPWEEE